MTKIPRVLNYKRDVIPPGAKLIMRGSPHGNPYVSSKQRSRHEAIRLFEENILPTLDVEPLRGYDLVCCCAPAACHGHSIFRKLYGNASPY